MALHNEIEFENDICDHLAAHGWLYAEKDAANYDRKLALFPTDVIAWVQQTDPDAWQTLTKNHGAAAEATLFKRLRDSLDQCGTLHVIRNGFDVLGLRKPVRMAQFKPALSMNPDIMQRYAANRLRVVRQVHYSQHNENNSDLVLFLNGIPVATVEIKTDNTQSIDDAVYQYKKDRNPHPKGQAAEPLLTFPSGALVHFAVSSSRVKMTTKLAGFATDFLPFDLGDNGAAGNPLNPDGYRTSYLWEQVWERDGWLEILGRYMVAEKDPKKQITKLIFPRYHQLDATRKLQQAVLAEGPGEKYLIQHSAGSGKTNSIAWSAHFLADLHYPSEPQRASGGPLYYPSEPQRASGGPPKPAASAVPLKENEKIFDTVLVVSDRRVIDGQLQDAIYGFERTAGVVATIKGDQGSKSAELAEALSGDKKIVVCTIQTFPFALQAVRELAATQNKRFAVIADEAHSSQSGEAASKLKMILSAEEQQELEDGGTISSEDILAAQMASRAADTGITYVAFTATPKAKTLELFGRRPDPTQPAGEGNLPEPFHVYSMRQAIEEGFILDVLRNYTAYKLAFKLAKMSEPQRSSRGPNQEKPAASAVPFTSDIEEKPAASAAPLTNDTENKPAASAEPFTSNTEERPAASAVPLTSDTEERAGASAAPLTNDTGEKPAASAAPLTNETEVERSTAVKGLMNWVRLHPYNIAQKVQIVVEHFRETVAPLLEGRAKAMVVTSSRVEAIRWQIAINKYIHEKGYPLRTLVAFSGEVNDKESGPDAFKETSTELNPDLKGRNIAEAFKDDQFQILLVANKFQTGFDQPQLCGMYVDKRLAGIQAVQTLSRLNRCYPGKDDTFVLDFVNEPSEVLDAFKTYFTTAQLSDVTDPNIILTLRTKLDALGYYDEHEIDRVVKVVLDPSSKQQHLEAAITPVADRLLKKFAAAKAAHAEAVENKDAKAAQAAKDAMDALVLFRSDATTYLRAYTFLSQIFDYGNTDFEKRAIFFKYLVKLLKFGREREGVDLSEVTLTHHKLSNRGKRNLGLSDEDAPKLDPMTEIGSGAVREKEKAYLSEIISKLNEIYGTDTTDGDQLSHAATLKEKVLESRVLQQQATNNSKEQFANSPDLTNEIMNAIIDAMDVQAELSTKALNSAEIREGLKQILLNQLGLYEKLKSRAAST